MLFGEVIKASIYLESPLFASYDLSAQFIISFRISQDMQHIELKMCLLSAWPHLSTYTASRAGGESSSGGCEEGGDNKLHFQIFIQGMGCDVELRSLFGAMCHSSGY